MHTNQHSIGVVINYCTNDYKFIRHNIKRVAKFADEIIVSTSDHFFDGTNENGKILKKSAAENPEAAFVQLKFDPGKSIQPYWLWRLRRILKLSLQSGSQYWICYQRLQGYQALQKKHQYILFLDADEIVDDKLFIAWLNTKEYKKLKAIKLACYWYFRKPTYQATTIEDSPLMVKNNQLNRQSFFDYAERQGMYEQIDGQKKKMVLGVDKKPMVHHYCWARTKREMFKKTASWGHNRDSNWKKRIKEEFSHPIGKRDFVQGYELKKVKSFISK